LSHRKQNMHALLEVGSHDADSIEIEQALAGISFSQANMRFTGEIGRRSALFSPTVSQHGSERLLSESNLMDDAFFGRHYSDNGIHLQARLGAGWVAGVEHWQGEAFPATADESGGADDVYLQWQAKSQPLTLQAGLWAHTADAEMREDERYAEGGHTHGTVTVTVPTFYFSGSTDTAGAFADIGFLQQPWWVPGLFVSVARQSVEGELSDETRRALLAGDYDALVVQPYWRSGRHQWGIRWEQLVLDNSVTGAGAEELADSASLVNPGFNPERTSLGYLYSFSESVKLRLEYVVDETTITGDAAERRERVGAGIVWNEQLFRR
jgi:hypothetical protein